MQILTQSHLISGLPVLISYFAWLETALPIWQSLFKMHHQGEKIIFPHSPTLSCNCIAVAYILPKSTVNLSKMKAKLFLFYNLQNKVLYFDSAYVMTWRCSPWQLFIKSFLPRFSTTKNSGIPLSWYHDMTLFSTCEVFSGFRLSWFRDLTVFYSNGGAIDSVNSNQKTTSQPFCRMRVFLPCL